jgi:hypothetical protein
MNESNPGRVAELLRKFKLEHAQCVRDGVRSPDFTAAFEKDLEELSRACDLVVVELFQARKTAAGDDSPPFIVPQDWPEPAATAPTEPAPPEDPEHGEDFRRLVPRDVPTEPEPVIEHRRPKAGK